MRSKYEHVAILNGHEYSYLDVGSGPALLFIHGLTGSSRNWGKVVDRLDADNHRVLAPDLHGHGASAKTMGDYSLSAHAASLRDLLDQLGIDRVTLVGHSLGGGIAMQFAYQFPERIERLALVNSGGLGPEVSPFLRAATLPGSEYVLPLLASPPVRAVGRFLDRLVGGHLSPTVRETMVSFGSLGDPATRDAFVHTARSVIDIRGQRVDPVQPFHRNTQTQQKLAGSAAATRCVA